MTHVLVAAGGPDSEHNVSLASAAAITAALRDAGHDVRSHTLPRLIDDCALADLTAAQRDHGTEVVFPALHGPWGEGGGFQYVLELMGLPFVGADATAAALAMDKERLKAVVRAAGHATPDSQVIGHADELTLAPPLVLKPVADGSSVDMALCYTDAEVETARCRLHPRRKRMLAERLIDGREMTIGIIDGELLPEIEIIPATAFYDYDAKYDRDDTRYDFDPDIAPAALEQARATARAAWELSGARDLARVDFLVDDAGAWFLELNTMPGFTAHSLLPKAAERAGVPLPELVDRLVALAMVRRGTCAPSGTFKQAAPIGRS